MIETSGNGTGFGWWAVAFCRCGQRSFLWMQEHDSEHRSQQFTEAEAVAHVQSQIEQRRRVDKDGLPLCYACAPSLARFRQIRPA